MAHCFKNFFCQKILNIHTWLPSNTLSYDIQLVEESCMSMMDPFELLTETDMRQLLKRSSNAIYAIGPISSGL